MDIKILLRQHVGNPCSPVVKPGDRVQKGQLIAEPQGLGANLHSSMYGTVKDITSEYIVIEPDAEQKSDYVKIKDTVSNLDAIKEAGVVGAGGAGFPTHVKLKVDLEGGYVIANASECEPVLAHNIAYIEEHAAQVVRGVRYVMQITNAAKGYIAIKPKHSKAVRELKKAAYFEKDIEVKFLPDMYPAGDERVIVREFLGVELQPGQLPSVAKAVISNVETIKRVVEAIEERKPFICKDITVGGRVKGESRGNVFLDVPLGMPVKAYIEKCGGYLNPHGEIVAGGPFTGKPIHEDTPITKTMGGILVAMPFPSEKGKVGLLCCECGAQEERLRQIAEGMGATVVAVERCKRMKDSGGGRYRCDLPGKCPGQAETVIALKKRGMEAIIAGTCGE